MEEELKNNLPGNKSGEEVPQEITEGDQTPLSTEQSVPIEEENQESSSFSEMDLSSKSSNSSVEEGGDKVISKVKLDAEVEVFVKNLLKKELNSEAQEIKKDFLIIFGLFASFVTFISINVQVFKNNDNTFELIGICSISLAFIVFFAQIINGIVKDSLDWKSFKTPAFFMNLIFLTLGILFITYGERSYKNDMNAIDNQFRIDSTEMTQLESEIFSLKNRLLKQDSLIDYQNATIIQLEKHIENLNKPKQKK